MDFNCVLVRYGEIALKGGNRGFFENTLAGNIRSAFKSEGVEFKIVQRISGRFLVESSDGRSLEALSKMFGVVSFSPAQKLKNDLGAVKAAALEALKERDCETFRVTARRLDKTVPSTSPRLNEEIGSFLVDKTGLKVKLKNPDVDIGVDFTKDHAFLHAKAIEGLGGLPVGVSGKVLCLLSGGIDSPVAGFLMMKRGCRVDFVHFLHDESRPPRKVIELFKILSKFQPSSRLFIVPSRELELELMKSVPAKYRIVLLRRMFMRFTEKLLAMEKAKAIVTGDNIGQVASQTLDNMAVVNQAVGSLIIRPLACFDKREITDLAVKIGTYDKSVEEYVDCCSFLVARHPETKASLDEVKGIEENIDMGIIDSMMAGMKVVEDKKG